jgi:hypothetical protein
MLLPWVLFAEASALFNHVLHGRRDEIAWLAERVRHKLPQLLAEDAPSIDYPVLGGVLLGEGCWVLTGDPSEDEVGTAVRMVALGYRFGYHRELPSLAWSNVVGLVEPLAPGRLLPLVERYADVPPLELLEEAKDALASLASLD